MPEADPARLKRDQAKLLEDRIPQGVDILHLFSNTWQAQSLLVKWVAFEAEQEWIQLLFFFFHIRPKQGDGKSSGFRRLQAAAVFHGRR